MGESSRRYRRVPQRRTVGLFEEQMGEAANSTAAPPEEGLLLLDEPYVEAKVGIAEGAILDIKINCGG